ncbi:MAG: hypothetical protein L3K13_06345, partial [Thermoplasmata archaeon]|nr:hypothetical protein [Thermoplasmata archaeon]
GLAFPKGPSSRWEESLTFQPGALVGEGQGLLFGGEQCTTVRCFVLGDTWTYANGLWAKIAPRASPSARFGASMAADPNTGKTLLFGGCGIVCPLGDTWSFANGKWTQLHPSSSPSARYFASLTYDSSDSMMVLFGGCEGGHRSCPDGDTWIFTSGEWVNATGSTGPTPPARFGAGSDGSSGFTILFGGMGASGGLNDLWWFENFTWQLLPVGPLSAPPAVVFPTFAYDPIDLEFLLWSGCPSSGCPGFGVYEYVFNGSLADVTLPHGGPAVPVGWYPWLPAGAWIPPNPSYGATAMFEPLDGPVGYVLIFGGRTLSGESSTVTEEFIGGAWNSLTPWT